MITRLILLGALLLQAAPAQIVTLPDSTSAVLLDGAWKRHAGDDPRYAEPGFDDTSWQTVGVPEAPPEGYFWYRIHLRVNPTIGDTPLRVLIGNLSSHYELFANGQRIGIFGTPGRLTINPQPAAFDVPHRSEILLAIRATPNGVLWRTTNGSSWFGIAPTIETKVAEWRLEQLRQSQTMRFLCMALLVGGIFFVAIPLWRPNSREYLWCGLYLLFGMGNRALSFLPDSFGLTDPVVTLRVLFLIATVQVTYIWGNLCRALFGGRLGIASWLAIAINAVMLIALLLGPGLLGNSFALVGSLSAVFLNLTEAILYLDTTRIWRFFQSGTSRLRRENLGAVHVALGILMFCSILHAALPFTGLTNGGDLSAINLILRYPMLLFMFAMGIILNRRAAASDLEGARLKSEVEAAVEIQRLMLPESQSAEVDAVYLPAAEVGGDFYQILPRSDGSRLIVVGDVSGKGLRAAMLVPLVIGALRHEQADSPAAVLAGLNRVLHGQTGNGFVTCCCLHVSPGGEVRIANAGHLAPYYRGKEMSMESGLPLGLAPDAEYTESLTELERGGQITLLSDGVLEAANAAGELFGFERTAAISGKPARQIAEAARAWGQNDDITVVTVQRTAIRRTA